MVVQLREDGGQISAAAVEPGAGAALGSDLKVEPAGLVMEWVRERETGDRMGLTSHSGAQLCPIHQIPLLWAEGHRDTETASENQESRSIQKN